MSMVTMPGRSAGEWLSFPMHRFTLASILERLLEWRERANQRQMVGGLDDRLLRDVGLTRSEVLFPQV